MKQIIFLAIICVVFSSCAKDDCTRSDMVEIEERSIPDTVMNNENIEIIVKASASNLCWSDLYVELQEKELFEYTVKAYGTFTCCSNCACPTAMIYMDTVINFQPTQKGTYLFYVSESQNNIVGNKRKNDDSNCN